MYNRLRFEEFVTTAVVIVANDIYLFISLFIYLFIKLFNNLQIK